MKLKNAGFESELDMMTALVGGETVYIDLSSDQKVDIQSLFFVDGSLSSGYTGDVGAIDDPYELAQSFTDAKVECKWYENITKPVPCWVWDGDEKGIDLIEDYDSDLAVFVNSCGVSWERAIPMEACDLLGGDDDSE